MLLDPDYLVIYYLLIFFTLLLTDREEEYFFSKFPMCHIEVGLHYPSNDYSYGLMDHTITSEVISFLQAQKGSGKRHLLSL